MTNLKNILKYDKKIMLFLNIIAVIGIISGSIFVIIINKNDKKMMIVSINNLFNKIKENNFDFLSIFKNTIFNNFIISFIIWIIGISVIGIVITILLVFYKCFILSFTISSIIYVYSFKGIILSIIYIFPHMIVNILTFLYISSYSIKLSIILTKTILKRENLNFKQFLNNYLKVLLISIVILFLSSIYESIIMPYILKSIIRFLI